MFLAMIRSLTFVLHLPMMVIAYNAVVLMFFRIIIPIAMFDVLESFFENGEYLPGIKFAEDQPEPYMD